ncbi:cation-dependent mannose-6-phosphate receptor [Sporothrix schenckii 1099-18]|uniref:Autophagy-related protein 27 n=1 Tax=Sporothrix schenckii 1099-18 TaxID=1397361 RepID=A0A0F2LWN6_SPOSC|nr:cation-dependent mannose-6-phosphate receptor [Sporothrix schenckii 1099-18]KJR81868.1 cation-dependent mannose-6-phosphate receptor [Sporothrix schenckii 1099-18]
MQLPRSPLIFSALAAVVSLPSAANAAATPIAAPTDTTSPAKTTSTIPCTASSTSGAFYDLRHDIALPPAESGKKPKAGVLTTDYVARGHDYGANFTLNICAAVVKPVKDVKGVDRDLWANVSAYYKLDGDTFSLGQESSVLVSRGRELVLQYTGGSPCPDLSNKSGSSRSNKYNDKVKREIDSEPMFSTQSSPSSTLSTTRRKSATFAFLCDRDPVDTTAHVSFVGTPDQCAYFFKIRSPHACAGVEPHKPGSVGPGGVFAIILGVALLVYFIGGVAYNRTVAHARGWRQLPNHTIWLGIWSFVRVRILCGRRFGSGGGRGAFGTGSSDDDDEQDRMLPGSGGDDLFWGSAAAKLAQPQQHGRYD